MPSTPRALLAFGTLLAGCSSSQPVETCFVSEAYQTSASSATLLSSARLERVRSGGQDTFVLLGADKDGSNVRWAILPRDKTKTEPVSPTIEGSVQVPDHVAGPWFALAGASAPADTVVIAWGQAGAQGQPFDIRAYAVSLAAGQQSAASAAQLLVAELDPGTQVAMGSARSGRAAALAWGPAGTGLRVAVVGADARLTAGQPIDIAPPSSSGTFAELSCIGFFPGTEDISLGYADRLSGTKSRWFAAELRSDDGLSWGIPTSYDYQLAAGMAACPVFAAQPEGDGYVFSWQDSAGTWLGVGDEIPQADADPVGTVDTSRVLSASLWSGVPPTVGGIAVMPRHRYAVLFESPQGPQLWPVDGTTSAGRRLALPTAQGRVGSVGYQPMDGALWVTYADYTGTGTSSGSRYLLKVQCP